MGIGKTLTDILNEKNSNANELAERIGVNPSTIYSIIKRDNMKVDIIVLAKICKELNVNMERFYQEYAVGEGINLLLSKHETDLVLAYRKQPSMQDAVDRILNIEPDTTEIKKQA